MKRMTRVMSLLLCVLMLLACFASCKKDEVSEDTQDTTQEISTTEEETGWETDENGYVKDGITPDMVYNKEEVKILAWKDLMHQTIPQDGGDGKDSVLTEVYYQRLDVESRLDVRFNVEYINAGGTSVDQRNDFLNKLMSGDGGYDLIQTFSLFPMLAAQQGLLVNLKAQTFPQFEMPWWPESLGLWEQHGKLYFAANNSSVPVINAAMVVFSNTSMITNAGLTDPVQLTVEGKWTIDTMLEYAKVFAGDAVADPGKTYGLVLHNYTKSDALYYAAFNSTVNNDKGEATLAFADASYRGRINDYCKKITDAFMLPEIYIAPTSQQKTLFDDVKSAFIVADMSEINSLRSTATYAVVPIPMAEEGGEYRTIQSNAYDVWCIPNTTDNAELSGVVIEAFSSSEYRKIAPFYFEKYLRDRYAQSAQGSQAFDIIRKSIFSDFGRVAQFSLVNDKGASIGAEALWRLCMGTKDGENPQDRFETVYAEWGGLCGIKLKELVTTIYNNNR